MQRLSALHVRPDCPHPAGVREFIGGEPNGDALVAVLECCVEQGMVSAVEDVESPSHRHSRHPMLPSCDPVRAERPTLSRLRCMSLRWAGVPGLGGSIFISQAREALWRSA